MLNKTANYTFDSSMRIGFFRRQNIRNEQVDPETVRAKVIEDINFLRGRIDRIKRSNGARINPSIVKTYESMLESREAILSWLEDITPPVDKSPQSRLG